MPGKGLPASLRTVVACQCVGCIVIDERTHLADRRPLGLLTFLNCLPLENLYLLLKRLVLGVSSFQKLFKLFNLFLVSAGRLQFCDCLLVIVSYVPAGSERVLFVAQVLYRKPGCIEFLRKRRGERPLNELEVRKSIGDYPSRGLSVGLWRTVFQGFRLTVLNVFSLSLTPHVQFLAVCLGIFRNVIKVHHDPLGGRNHPLIRGGVSILFLEGTELMIKSGQGG